MKKLLAILLFFSTQAYALDPCMSGQFKVVDRQYTGMNLMFKPDSGVYGQWFSLIPVDGGIRGGLPTWSEIFGEHYDYVDEDTPVIEASLNFAWIDSPYPWEACIAPQGTLTLYPVTAFQFFPMDTMPNAQIDYRYLSAHWKLWLGSDGDTCEGTCKGDLLLERVTYLPVGCNHD